MQHFARLTSATRAIAIAFLFLFSASAIAMPAAPMEYSENQPDGSTITLRVRGDEHYSWAEDVNGYTVISNKDWFEYAERGVDGTLQTTGLIVGRDDPEQAGLERGITASADVRALSAKIIKRPGGPNTPSMNVPPLGTVKNLVVMVRFSNHVSRPLPSAADMDVLFNTVGGDPTLAPTGSVRDVYFENSYGQMALDSDINPGINDWITVSNTEAYYANGVSGDSTLWQALREALNVLDTVVDFRDYDTDNNGRIDSIAFIHSGYGAEWGGTDAYGTHYTNRIWSHRWAIQPQWNSNDGVSVFDYHISPGVWGTSGSNIGRIGVIAHETGHFFGLPDLYDTSGSGSGIGSWGLMANSWDFNGTQLCPPHFSPWSKVNLGWYTPTVISQPGQYSINRAESNPEVYRVDSGYPSQEYLMIENRQNAGFDCTIPQGGLLIWHIDDSTGYNTEGYPGQAGWPGNGNHYRVAVLQADGDYDLERDNNRGDSGDTHHGAGVDAIGPGPGNHPNTDAYKNGNIIETGHIISDVSASGSSMSFCFNGCSGLPAPSSLNATAQGTNAIALAWTDNSTSEDGFNIERSNNGSNWSALASTGANATNYTDNGLNPGATWFYRVQAFNASETSAWSNTASATTDLPPNVPPTAGFTHSCTNLDCSFTDTSTDSDGTIVSWSWDFGDGNGSSAQNPNHIYASAGSYTVSLTVTDNGGETDNTSTLVTVTAPPAADFKLHTGVVNNVDSSGWTTVVLPESFTSMVVVATVSYNALNLPAVTRIRNASGNSFDVRLANPGGSPVGPHPVHYLAVEEGVFTQAVDGITLEAVKYISTVTGRKNGWSWETRSYSNSYSNPVVLGQVMSYNDPDWSVFWATGSSRTVPPSASSLGVGKHVAEDTDITRADEVVGYIVVEAGSGTLNGLEYAAGVGSDIVQGPTNSPPFSYAPTGVSTPTSAVVSTAALDGGDGGWPLLYGANPVSPGNLDLMYDEDQISNSERSHTTEQVAYMVFGSTGGNVPPTAGFTHGCTDLDCGFTDTSTDSDGTIVSWSWDFGDGNGSSSQNPNHSYASAGSYTVSLTVTDDGGETDNSSALVTVTDPPVGWTDLTYDDFESGWGNWVDGGSDARLSGTFVIDTHGMALQDNSSTSYSQLSSSLDLSGYTELQIEFSYVVQSFENSEDFWVRFSSDGGSTWQTVQAFVNNVDFVDDGTRYDPVITIDSGSYTFNSNVKIRFQCDASGNRDDVYIDNIRISAQ